MRIAMATSLSLSLIFGGAIAQGQDLSTSGSPLSTNCEKEFRSTYLLGPEDEVEISGPELDEPAGRVARVDGDGDIQVPLVGRVHVADLTAYQAQEAINKRLSTYIRDPQITVSVKELRSQPVSILGAVTQPGVYQVRGYKTLLEMVSLAGGLRVDAGYSIRITRRLQSGCLPLPNATLDASRQFIVGEVRVKDITSARVPQRNIQILPHDVISVPKAEMVYVIGDVKRSGGFVIGEHESLSVLQVLSLAEGMNGTADKKHAKILRESPAGGKRSEIAVDVKAILEGKSGDVALRGDDILFVPDSTGKKASIRALETAVQTGSSLLTGVLIWRR